MVYSPKQYSDFFWRYCIRRMANFTAALEKALWTFFLVWIREIPGFLGAVDMEIASDSNLVLKLSPAKNWAFYDKYGQIGLRVKSFFENERWDKLANLSWFI